MKKLTIIFLFLMLFGCNAAKTAPVNPLPVFEIPKGSKLGVINFVEQKMRRVASKPGGYQTGSESDFTTDMPYHINNEIQRQAAEIGYKVEILDVDEDIKRVLYFCTLEENHQIILRPATIPVFQKLADDHNLSIIYLIKESEDRLKIKNHYVAARGYGMAVGYQGGFNAFAALKAEAIYLDPVTLTRGAECLGKRLVEGHPVSGETGHRKVKVIPSYEVVESVKLIINDFISDLLKNSNLRG